MIMKKIFTLIAIGFTCFAQAQTKKTTTEAVEELDPVTWKAGIDHIDGADYVVVTANIEKGWHIFTNNPGGDGFAIPTSINLVNSKDTIKITDRMASVKPTQHNFEGMGVMNFFEGKVVYKALMPSHKERHWRLLITYQCCNDKMCLPPADVDMLLK
jgi:Disulphide bond corrector protein DsbC